MQTSNLAEVCLLQRPCHLVFISGLPFGLDEVRHVEFFSSRMGLDHAVDSRLRGPDESLLIYQNRQWFASILAAMFASILAEIP